MSLAWREFASRASCDSARSRDCALGVDVDSFFSREHSPNVV